MDKTDEPLPLNEINDAEAKLAIASRLDLLSRQAPEGYLEEWSQRLRQPLSNEASDRFGTLIFRIGKEWLCIAVNCVAEITSVSEIHSVPHRSNEILLGIANVGGDLEIAISMSTLLHLDDAEHPGYNYQQRPYSRMIVLNLSGDRYVFEVNEVYGVVHFERHKMEEPPITISHAISTFSKGIFYHKDLKIDLLDEELISHRIKNQNI